MICVISASPHLQGRAPFTDANSGLRAQSTPANYAEQQQQVCSGREMGCLR